MITCKLNHFFNPNAEGIKKSREIASTWVSEREKQDPQNRYHIEPIEFDDLMIFLDKHNFTVPKRCVSVREPYSAERRKAASERAKAAGYRPPIPKLKAD